MQTGRTELIFSGTSHPALAGEISETLRIKLGKLDICRFPDGEVFVQVKESVRGRDVFVVQSIALDPDHYLIELLVIVDALKRASAANIVAVIPYFGYARQDKMNVPRVPITAKLVANLLVTAGVSRVVTLDLHAGQLQGFFDIPLENLDGRPVLVDAYKKHVGNSDNTIVVSPDVGSIKIARKFARHLGVDFAIVDKHRKDAAHIDVVTLIGDVKGKDVLLADDMCTTGGTLLSAAKACQEKGARSIVAAITHGLFVGDAINKINDSSISALITTNTVPQKAIVNSAKIKAVSVAPLMAKAIHCIFSQESILPLFE